MAGTGKTQQGQRAASVLWVLTQTSLSSCMLHQHNGWPSANLDSTHTAALLPVPWNAASTSGGIGRGYQPGPAGAAAAP